MEKCYKCKKPIVPVDGSNIAPRLRALNQNYHPECFKCEVKYFKLLIVSFSTVCIVSEM